MQPISHSYNRQTPALALSHPSISLPFLLLPLTLYAGVAAQASGLYLFALIWPGIALHGVWSGTEQQRVWARLGLLLAGMWLVFPLTNLLNLWWPLHATVEANSTWELPLRKVFSSQLSSTWIVSAVFLCLFGLWPVRRPPESSALPGPRSGRQVFHAFLVGFALAASLFGVYFLVQHLTGFDYRRDGLVLTPNNLMGGSHYRVFGFYGHPLTMAGVSLAALAFFWTLGLLLPKEDRLALGARLPLKLPCAKYLCLYVASLNLSFLVFSGGRTALMAGALFLLLSTGLVLGRRLSLKMKVSLAVLFAATMIAIVLYSGLTARFAEVVTAAKEGRLLDIERFVFWRVYAQIIADNPWFGQGAAHLSAYLRDAYYGALGLGDFHQKYNAHNIYLEVLADVGALGALTLAAFGVLAVRSLLRLRGQSPLAKAILWSMLSALMVNAIHGLTQNVFFDASVLAVYLAFVLIYVWVSLLSQGRT